MRGADDDDYINNDELYPKGTLTQSTLETPPVIIGPPPRWSTKGRGTKILPRKQLLQRLSILLGQVKTGNESENLLN